MTPEEHAATRLTAERRERGWSQERLAQLLTSAGAPMPQSAISKLQSGARGLSLNETVAAAHVLGIELDELIGGQATEHSPIRANSGVETWTACRSCHQPWPCAATKRVTLNLTPSTFADVVAASVASAKQARTIMNQIAEDGQSS